MAAVLLLVFLPVFAAALFMFGSLAGHLSLISVLAVLLFAVLGGSIVIGMMKMSVGWDHEEHHP